MTGGPESGTLDHIPDRAPDVAPGPAPEGATEGPADEVTVVVITYSPGPDLDRFLDTLREGTSHPYRVIVVDNGSDDGAPERAERERPEVTLLHSGGNLGYGRAANLGAARAETPWLVVANPDLTWTPGSLDTLLDARGRWPRAGAIGPAILTADGALYPSARALPSLGRGIGHALCGWWWPGNPWTRSYRREREAPAEGPVGWLSGSVLLLRRETFLTVHGFDPGYFMYFEDTDLGERIGLAGWLNVYAPGAVVVHEGGHATSRRRSAMVAEHHKSAYRYLSRRYSGTGWIPLRLGLHAGLAARSGLSRLVHQVGEGARPTRGAESLTGPEEPGSPD